MNRRGFFLGMLQTTAAGLLIPASAGELAIFQPVVDHPVVVEQAEQNADLDGLLYDQRGTPIAVITNVSIESLPFDVTTAQDSHIHQIPGLTHSRIEARPLAAFNDAIAKHKFKAGSTSIKPL